MLLRPSHCFCKVTYRLRSSIKFAIAWSWVCHKERSQSNPIDDVSEGTMLHFTQIWHYTYFDKQFPIFKYLIHTNHIILLAQFRSNTSKPQQISEVEMENRNWGHNQLLFSDVQAQSPGGSEGVRTFFYDVQIFSVNFTLINDWECESFLNWETNGLANFPSGPQHPGHP